MSKRKTPNPPQTFAEFRKGLRQGVSPAEMTLVELTWNAATRAAAETARQTEVQVEYQGLNEDYNPIYNQDAAATLAEVVRRIERNLAGEK